jgi:hypothetical protein
MVYVCFAAKYQDISLFVDSLEVIALHLYSNFELVGYVGCRDIND